MLVVHHARKGAGNARAGQALRGSSEFHAWGDFNLYTLRLRNIYVGEYPSCWDDYDTLAGALVGVGAPPIGPQYLAANALARTD